MNTMKKKKSNNEERQSSPVKFCTECGEELEDFSISGQASDGKSAKERFHNCQKSGKFNGDICSRVFIADFREEDLPKDEDINLPGDEL